MFSLDRFYNILHDNLISKFTNGRSIFFYPFGTYDTVNVLSDKFDIASAPFGPEKNWTDEQEFFHCYYFDQEPIYDDTIPIIRNSFLNSNNVRKPNRINILANSEHSDIKTQCIQEFGMQDWYYFYHGFAALDWYRNFQYVSSTQFDRFDKVFICYNHLTSKYRSYRLHLVSNLIEQNLVQYGHVSLFHNGWKKTIEDPNVPLDNRARVKIYNTLKNVEKPLIIDTETPIGSLSADVLLDQLTSALFHVVTETIYFQPKLHLTEKIFKPIVARRPFLLVAAPGNLAYLKSYGFKTFDRWIDESYDLEQDHYVRIEKITEELARLCSMEPADLIMMHKEMQEVLDYNFNHFYTTFKDVIIDEMIDNFQTINNNISLNEVKKRLKQ